MKILKKLVCGTMSFATVMGMTAVPASAKSLTYSSYDFNRDGKKDDVMVTYSQDTYYSQDEDVYYNDGLTYNIYFNNKKIYSHKDQSLTGLSAKVIKLDAAVLLDIKLNTGHRSKSILYRLNASKATEVFSSAKMFKHTNYFYTYDNPIYRVSGNTIKVQESNAYSRAVGGFVTTVYYRYQNGQMTKTHSIYQIYSGKYNKYLKAKKKLTLYESYRGKKKAFTVKKGQEIRLLRAYDGKSAPRFYVLVKGKNKKGWLKAITNRGMNQHVYFSNNDFRA